MGPRLHDTGDEQGTAGFWVGQARFIQPQVLRELAAIVAEDEVEVLVLGRFDELDVQSPRILRTHHPGPKTRQPQRVISPTWRSICHSLLCYAPSRARRFYGMSRSQLEPWRILFAAQFAREVGASASLTGAKSARPTALKFVRRTASHMGQPSELGATDHCRYRTARRSPNCRLGEFQSCRADASCAPAARARPSAD